MEGPFPQIHGPNFCEEKKIELLKNNSVLDFILSFCCIMPQCNVSIYAFREDFITTKQIVSTYQHWFYF